MAADGRAIVFISHKLHEVLEVSDRVTVLRGGRVVATVPTSRRDAGRPGRADGRARGRDRPSPAARAGRSATSLLEAHDLHAEGDRGLPALRGVSLAVRGGEIVGVAGVAGNGQRELAEALTGLRPRQRAASRSPAPDLRPGDPRDAIAHRVAHVPEDRLGTGVAPSLSIADNTVLKAYRDRELSAGPFLRRSRIVQRATELIARYGGARRPGPRHAPAISRAATCRRS